jgi:putative ABC transport system ATP-binding protein
VKKRLKTATNPMDIVRLENNRKIYEMGSEPVHALDGVSMSFGQGSFWAIMGASGSGKSTMMNILGCLDRPTSGQYFLQDKDVSTLNDDELSDIRLKYIGFIFQSSTYSATDGSEKSRNCLSIIWLRRRSSEKKAKELAEKVGS